MHSRNVKLSASLTDLSDQQIDCMAEIVCRYFPNMELAREITRGHVKQAHSIRMCLDAERLIGFSVASKYRMLTPFYHRPVNVLYQRMLYLEPAARCRGIGLRLLEASMKDLFGRLWPLKRMVAVCRTQNPMVARFMAMYDQIYPRYGETIPDEVRKFAESLLPVLEGDKLDARFRLFGTLSVLSGMDFTDIWNRYLHRQNDEYERLMLNSAFEESDGHIFNRGAGVLMIGYAKPLCFIRYLFGLRWREDYRV